MFHTIQRPGKVALTIEQGLLKIERYGESVTAGKCELLSEIWLDLTDEQWFELERSARLERLRRCRPRTSVAVEVSERT